MIFALVLRAIVLKRRGDVERAGSLWGAVDRLDAELGETMWRNARREYEELLGTRDPAFESGVEAGRKLPLEDAVAVALLD